MRSLPLAAALLLLPLAALAQDADGDGAPNGSDAYPCDPGLAAAAFAPGEGVHGTLLIEDQWPLADDLDTNDTVLGYNYVFRLDAAGGTRSLQLALNVLAVGGVFDNGLALHLPIPRAATQAVTMTVGAGAPVALSPSAADAELTVVLQGNLRSLFGGATGAINSRPELPRQVAPLVVVEVTLAAPVALDLAAAPFDLFIFRSGDPGHEIHRPGYSGSAAMNAGLFGTQDDGSTPGRRFVDSQGIPSVLVLPEATPYPAEGVAISALFPNILLFAASGGASAADFYLSPVVASARYADVNGLGAPSPQAPPAPVVDTACVDLADEDGDGVVAANDWGNPELCDGLDNDCDGVIDEGTTAMFGTFFRDADGDGFGDPNASVQACGVPPGYVGGGGCTNGSVTDCNPSGATLISSSAFVDANPPAGWRQCAGFINTSGDDVSATVLDRCLGATGLRVRVWTAGGQLEEDVYATNLSALSSWPSWNYLGGSLVSLAKTYWGDFVTTDRRDACGQTTTAGGMTFGSGNGSRALIAGGNPGGDEYRVNCGGQSLVDRRIAVYAYDASTLVPVFDCDDADPANTPNATELCDGQDNDCDGAVDEGLRVSFLRDRDGDGFGDAADSVQACSAPPGYVAGAGLCTNGSATDCNVSSTTLNPSSAFVDPQPPSGWVQCAGFHNTTGAPTFLDHCLARTSLRVRVWNTASGQLEEDVYSTTLTPHGSWPAWDYLGGSLISATSTYWGSTTFFTTTDRRDACGHTTTLSGATFGSGNGSRALLAGGNTGADEYRVSCGGQGLADRRIAIYTLAPPGQPTVAHDCDDGRAEAYPGAPELCNGLDDDCDAAPDEGNPEGGASCSTGLGGACGPGTVTCSAGALMCSADNAAPVEVCADGSDNDCDGVVDEPVCSSVLCSNGSPTDCNVNGTTLIASSACIDYAPPSGWTQCAGFINTAGDDVAPNFLDHCLGASQLRLRVWDVASGVHEEDVTNTGLGALASWPSWSYLGGSLTAAARTYWGPTAFFTTTDRRDACGQTVTLSGTTFGSGNGSRALIAGGNSGADEYRVNCGGQSLGGRRIALYR